MPVISELDFKKQMEKSEFSNLYVIYGEEKYLVGYYARKLMDKAGNQAFPSFNMQKFDGEKAGADAVAEAVTALPFMAGQKCVAVSNPNFGALKAGEAKKWDELFTILPDTTVLLLYFPTLDFNEKRDKAWKKMIDLAAKIGMVFPVRKRTNAQLQKILCSGAKKRGCVLSGRDADRLVSCCGNDMNTLLNELEKLCAFVGKGEITARDIESLTVKNLEVRVFDLSKAILSGAYNRAYSILDLLFYQNEEPVALLSVLSSAYLDLYRVRAAVSSGLDVREPARHFDYARKEFRLTNAERDSRRFSVKMIRDSLRVLLRADTALKSSRGNRRVIMEKLIAELLLIAERGKMND